MKLTEAFGQTPQVRYEAIGKLKEKIAAWEKAVRVFGMVIMAVELIILFFIKAGFFNILFLAVIGLPITWFGGKWFGCMYGWGWYTVKAWMGGEALRVGKIASQTIDNMILGTFLTGSGTSSLIGSLGIIVLFLAVGFYAGVFNMFRFEGEYRRLKKELNR